MARAEAKPDGTAPASPAILVPVDFSDHSRAALAWAVEAAALHGAPLLVVHVVHDPEGEPGFYTVPKRKKFLRRMEDAAADMMDEFMDDFRREYPEIGKLDVATELVVGLPATRIVELAAGRGARMIVMGSQGRSGLSRVLLGSKAQRVAQLADAPVVIVKAARDD